MSLTRGAAGDSLARAAPWTGRVAPRALWRSLWRSPEGPVRRAGACPMGRGIRRRNRPSDAGGSDDRRAAISDGKASGPGSWPPAYLTSACTRLSTEGWVANRSENPSRGLSRHNSITAEVAPGNSPRFSILRNAEIMASGFLVSSTDPASASSSRDRDSASRTICDNSQASAINATATMMTMIAPPPPEPLRSPSGRKTTMRRNDQDERSRSSSRNCRN